MLRLATISALLIFLLASCGNSGDFCDIYSPVRVTDGTALVIVHNDRPAAEAIAANQIYYGRHCGD